MRTGGLALVLLHGGIVVVVGPLGSSAFAYQERIRVCDTELSDLVWYVMAVSTGLSLSRLMRVVGL